MKLKTILTFLVLTLFTACGGKQGDTTSASLSLGFGAISNNALVDGGVMIYGWSDGGQSFAIKYTDEVLELENGFWRFAAFGWDDFALSGDLRCAYEEVSLEGGEQTIGLSLNQDNCKASIFGGNDVKDPTTGIPHILKFKTCGNESCLFDDEGGDAPLRGVAQSFKVILPGKNLDGALVKGPVLGTHGPCNNHDVTVYSPPSLNGYSPVSTVPGGVGPNGAIRLPIVNLDVPTIIRAYDETGCAGSFEEYAFARGLKDFDAERTFLQSDGSYNIIALKSNICNNPTQPSNLSGRNMRFWVPSDGTPNPTPNTNYICTADQFQEIASLVSTGGGLEGETYVLGRNINISSLTSYAQIGDPVGNMFDGEFFGNNFTINGGSSASPLVINSTVSSTGLFRAVRGGIYDLKIENIQINASGSPASKIGALVGHLRDGAEIENIEARNITIDTSSCSTVCTEIGGVIGGSSVATGSVWGREIKAFNIEIITADDAEKVGGIIGQLGNNVSLDNLLIDGVSFETPNAINTALNFGGVVGFLEGNLRDTIAKNVNMISTLEKPFYPVGSIGGVVGRLSTSGSISYAKSSGIIAVNGSNSVGGVIGFVADTNGGEDLINNMDIEVTTGSPSTDGMSVGGVVGAIYPSGGTVRLRRLRNFGDINDCGDDCGGVIGYAEDNAGTATLEFEQLHNYGAINSSGSKIGGVVGRYKGQSVNSILSFASNTGTIIGSGFTGGVIGQRESNGSEIKVEYAFNKANIHSTSANSADVGGLIGDAGTINNGDLNQMYNIGNVTYNAGTGFGDIGTFISGGTPPTLAITECHAEGAINTTVAGGICDTITTVTSFASYTKLDTEWLDNGNGHPNFKNWKPIQVLESPISGTLGSRLDPFRISSVSKWNSIRDNKELMSRSFILTNNINFSGQPFEPIGSSNHPFTGSFNGNNKELANIILNETGATDHLGVFRVIGEKGFCDLPTYTNISTCDGNGGNWFVDSSGEIGDWNDDDDQYGKLILRNINFSTDASGKNIGILAGLVEDQETVSVTERGRGVEIFDIEIINGSVGNTGGASHVGTAIGLLKINNSNTEIENIKSSAYVMSNECGVTATGGIIGSIEVTASAGVSQPVRTDNFKYSGDISCSSQNVIGGIVGAINNVNGSYALTIERLENTANINGFDQIGGLFGSTSSFVEVSAGFSKADISGNDEVGGIAGFANGSVYTAVYAEGQLSASLDAGGIIAMCSSCTLTNSYSNVLDAGSTTFNHIVVNETSITSNNNYYIRLESDTPTDTYGTHVESGAEIDPANMPDLSSGLPGPFWFHFFGDSPKLYFEVLDESVLD